MFTVPPVAADRFSGIFQATQKIDPTAMHPKQAYTPDGKPSGEDKLVDGHRVYRIPAQYIDDSGIDNSVSLQVFTMPTAPIPALAQLVPTGTVRMVPWVRNGRIAWSLTADGIEVLDSTTGVLDD